MKSELKKILISFIALFLIDSLFSQEYIVILGLMNVHVGLLFVFGLLFGPYGALGATLGNILMDLINGYTPIEILPSAIITFGVSYLAYKLWYSGFRTSKITRPKLDNTYHLSQFLSSIVICGLIYSICHGILVGIIAGVDINIEFFVYFFNFINVAFVAGIISIWLSEKIDFVHTPKKSERTVNKRLYGTLFSLLLIVTILSCLSILTLNINIMIGELIIIGILLFAYLTKPFEYEIQPTDENTITEKIVHIFLIITLFIAILGVAISILSYTNVENTVNINIYLYIMPMLLITDAVIVLFFIPGMIILKYVEEKVLKPISSFSEIERFIKENEKIEAEGLVNVYSKYLNEKNEIGTLARSYTYLINHNNDYIENIREIEGEKERIKAELDIATRIQAANLPTEAIANDDFIVDGYSNPAKEVGGDFFDYYLLDDDNLAIVLGDVSGKGVPAAILAMICQVMIKQLLKNELDPSKVFYSLNNQLCEHNPESMFITSWLGIYNKTTKKITFSNAGHNPPLIKENGEFKYLDVDTGIVLGVMEDFNYLKEEMTLKDELVLYSDGITDANNNSNEMYGEDRLLEFFNGFESDDDPIVPLLNDISDFTEDAEQYDDMTLLYLKDRT